MASASPSVSPSPAVSPSPSAPPSVPATDYTPMLGWLVALLLLLALIVVWARRRAGGPAAPVTPAPPPTPAPALAAAPIPRPAVEPATPVLLGGRPSAATRYPWRLPAFPAQPGLIGDEARLGGLDVRAASIVGPGHRCEEPAGPRQDVYRLARDRDGQHLIIAVADGVSASARSDLGATVAATAAVTEIRRRLDAGATPAELKAPAIFESVAAQMVAAAADRGASARDVCCALLVAVVPAHRRDEPVWLASLADVSAWLHGTERWQRLTGADKDGLDHNTLAHVLPLHPQYATGRLVVVPAGAALAILTDGVSDAFAEVEGAQRWFAQRWQVPPALGSFLADVNFEARGQLDDRTAVVVWCGAR
ncbi:protein phosphatase 2C domain-containing protein [Dactylosporangium sp. NPDC051541]|uniref:protein phosphatase 2C domain-containing protein n=1 Tax=Dactylosporangium sp. NPDC051541 TaxID=3363977 RepID=UPI0037BB8501